VTDFDSAELLGIGGFIAMAPTISTSYPPT